MPPHLRAAYSIWRGFGSAPGPQLQLHGLAAAAASGAAAATASPSLHTFSTHASPSTDLDEEVVVIGAGVVGLAVARELALAGRGVLLLEAAGAVGTETSSRSSEVIHAGRWVGGWVGGEAVSDVSLKNLERRSLQAGQHEERTERTCSVTPPLILPSGPWPSADDYVQACTTLRAA